jgi:hypothetical protein
MSASTRAILPAFSPALADSAEFSESFHRLEAEIRAVPARDLIPVNVDVPAAITTVLGCLPALKALRSELAQLPGFNLERFDRLRDYALALGHTHAMHRTAAGPSDAVRKLANELSKIRDVLQTDAMALAKRRLLDQEQIIKLRGGAGYKSLAFEVASLIGLFREHWVHIEKRTAIQLEELEYAGRLAQKLITAVGVRAQAPAAVNAAATLRKRAFTLFSSTYAEVRRAVAYVRRHQKDGDLLAPSLFARRTRRRSESKSPNESDPSDGASQHVTSPKRAGA